MKTKSGLLEFSALLQGYNSQKTFLHGWPLLGSEAACGHVLCHGQAKSKWGYTAIQPDVECTEGRVVCLSTWMHRLVSGE